MNEVYLNKTYAENWLKRFRIRKMQTENIKKRKINLIKSLKDVEKFKKIIEIVEKNFKENFEIKKKKFN